MRNSAERPAISTGPALMIPAGYPRDLPSALLRAAGDFSTAGVVEIGPDGRETRLDFPILLELAARILAGLRANGVRAGDPAVVHCTEPVGFFAAFWACTLGGIRPLLMAPSPAGDRSEEGRERLRKVTELLGWTVLIGRPSDLPDDLGLPVLDPDALAGHEPTSDFHRPAADDVAVLMLSSSSGAGTPRIIQLTHRGLVEFAAGTPAMLPVRPGQTTLNWLPLDHSGAFLLYHLLPVFTGCTNIHVATDWVLADPLRWLDLMDQHRVNHSWSPNFGYRLAATAIAAEPDRHWDLAALRSLVSGGEQITVPVVSEFLRLTNRFGVVPETFVAAWGMTETVTGITFARAGLAPNVHRVRITPSGAVEWVDQRSTGKVAVARPGTSRADAPGVLSLVSVGAPAPGATVRIVGQNGAVLPEGRVGQLQIASARVTPGYLGHPEADRAAFPAGNWPARKWLATGDEGFITGGQVVLTGRSTERLVLSGRKYYAEEVEAVAAVAAGVTPGLVAACAFPNVASGTDDLTVFYAVADGSGTAEFYALADGSSASEDAIRAAVREQFGLEAQVVGVPREQLPTTRGDKIVRPLLIQRWLNGTLLQPAPTYGEPAASYGDPAPTYGDPAASYGEPAASYSTRATDAEDPAEQTTELPVVRLAWRRSLKDSIPVPPARPTLGAQRPATNPTPTNTAPADAAPTISSPTDNAPGDTAPAASAPADPAPTLSAPADSAPAVSAPAVSAPADPAPAVSGPVDTAPSGSAPADRTGAAVHAPADTGEAPQTSTPDQPAKPDQAPDTAAQATSADLATSAHQAPTDQAPTDRTDPSQAGNAGQALIPTAEQPAGKQFAAEQPTHEQPADTPAAGEQPSDEPPTAGLPAHEQPTAEQPADTRPADEPADTDQPATTDQPQPAPTADTQSADDAHPAEVAEAPEPIQAKAGKSPSADKAELADAEVAPAAEAPTADKAEPPEETRAGAAEAPEETRAGAAEAPAADHSEAAEPPTPNQAGAAEVQRADPSDVVELAADQPAVAEAPQPHQAELGQASEPDNAKLPEASEPHQAELAEVPESDQAVVAEVSDTDQAAFAEGSEPEQADAAGAPEVDRARVDEAPRTDQADAAEVPGADRAEVSEVLEPRQAELAEVPESDRAVVAEVSDTDQAEFAEGSEPEQADAAGAPEVDRARVAEAPRTDQADPAEVPGADRAEVPEAPEPHQAELAGVPDTDRAVDADVADADPAEVPEVLEPHQAELAGVPESDLVAVTEVAGAEEAEVAESPGVDGTEVPDAEQTHDAEATEADPPGVADVAGADQAEDAEASEPDQAEAADAPGTEAPEPDEAEVAEASELDRAEVAEASGADEVGVAEAQGVDEAEVAGAEGAEGVEGPAVERVGAAGVVVVDAVELVGEVEGAERGDGSDEALPGTSVVEVDEAADRDELADAVEGTAFDVGTDLTDPRILDESASAEVPAAPTREAVEPVVPVEGTRGGADAAEVAQTSGWVLPERTAVPVEVGDASSPDVKGGAADADGVAKVATSGAAVGRRGAGKGAAGVGEPVAVVGLAGRFPGARSLEQFWENLVCGVESVRRFTPENSAAKLPPESVAEGLVGVGGVLDDVESFDAAYFGFSAREAELTDPAQRLFLEVCQQALEHGGYAGAAGRIGVFAGSGMNLYTQQNQPPDSLATRVAYRLGLTGPAIGVQAAWSSSLVAVHLACQALRSGDADLALAGAAAVQVPQATGYHVGPDSILSPSGHVRAFDADADGTVGGNGVAAVLLKRLDQAIADGDTVYAVVRGSAVSDAGAGEVAPIERALEKAGVPAESLSYLEANATGTAADDAAEFEALAAALRRQTDKVGFCTIGSVKPNIGHLDSAAGMAGLIKTILMLQHRTLVPTINYTQPNPELPLSESPFVIGTEVREWESSTPRRAGVSALDAGGTNAHVILEEAPRQLRREDSGPVVVPVSAPDEDALAELVELFRAQLQQGTGHRLIDLAGTAALGRQAHRHRVAVAGSSEAELAEALGSAQVAEVPRGGPGPLGYAFTGQGAARRGMAAGLAARFPVFRSVLDECDKVYAAEFGGSLIELLLTPAGTAEGVWPTETAQPALFAFELALARLWQSFGVQPALVVGHSVGEYAALCVAGALSLADGIRLTAQRGVLMQRGTVPGAMVAVRADADRVRELAQASGVEIAAGNGPQSYVLTGAEVIVGQLAEQLDRLELVWQRLDVDRAFHSSLVDPILADFAEVVGGITLQPLRMPMVSSWSGELLESGTVLDGDYLVGQLRQPVLFGDAVEALTAAGCRRFLELGPDAVLSPAGRRIAPNSTWIPTQRLGQDPVLATMNGLAELYEQGTEIAWSRVYPDSGRVPLPTYPFRKVHHPVDASARPVPRAQAPVVEQRSVERSGVALKRIPLDLPAEPATGGPQAGQAPVGPFAIPADEDDQVGAKARSNGVPAVPFTAPATGPSNEESPEPEPEPTVEPEPVVEHEPVAEPEPVTATSEGAAERYRESLEVVLDLTGEQLGLEPYDVTVDHTFVELGADSLSMLRVVEEVRQRFAVELAVSELFGELNTPHRLASAVASRNVPGEVDPLELLRSTPAEGAGPAGAVPVSEVPVGDSRAALAVLGSGLAELAAKVDAAAAATSEAALPGTGMAALMAQQLRVAGQLVDGVTKLMHEQLALLNTNTQSTSAQPVAGDAPGTQPVVEQAAARSGWEGSRPPAQQAGAAQPVAGDAPGTQPVVEQAAARSGEARAVLPDRQAGGTQGAGGRVGGLEFWRGVLDGGQALVLPGDGGRPGSGEVGSVRSELAAGLWDEVFAFSRDRRVSPLMTMLAAVSTVLGRFAAQDDLVIGAAALRRTNTSQANEVSNTGSAAVLPLRVDLAGEPDLGELAQRVRVAATAAFDHADVDLAVLELGPLFTVQVEFETGDSDLPPDLELRLRFEQHQGGVRCTADYRAGLFEESTIQRYLDYLEAVLRRATEDPRRSLPELMQPTTADYEALRDLEGAVAKPIVGRVRRDAVVAGELSGLHTLFEQQVARTPDAVALIQGTRELTYAELERRANAVAWQLVDLGIKPGELVAVRVARGTELVVAVLAVLKAGAAYLPLDPGVPESRWAFMTADAGAIALVGEDAALADRLGLRLIPVAAVDGDPRAKQAPPVRAAADDVAYCIYTSGSNGNPKGVAVPHRGPVNLVRQYLRTRRSLRTLQWTSFGFDVHVQEMFTALASGAALVLIGEDDRYDPDAVVAALSEHEVERLFMTFTPLTALLATLPELPKLPALREIVAGGEAMVLTHGIRDFVAAHPDCTLYNEYGPTEASVVTTIHQVDLAEDRPSIGRPIDGVVVRLLDEALRPVPVGAVGEIHLGGLAVAKGYVGRPEETAAVFVADPAHPGGRLYRSRDLGRWRPDGMLDFLGRADDQVKIRGHRVEPGETEHVLADQPGVTDAVVIACANPAGDTCLIGYVVLEDSNPAVLARLLLDLTKELPIYLVPADLIPVDELPLDASGKLDRSRLPEPEWLSE